ncbi:MAG: hypothetical protein F6K26_55535 [Moorea sp. SIO2I5]|nr:hypothetical protein [Moorena sp. SIO2I5]
MSSLQSKRSQKLILSCLQSMRSQNPLSTCSLLPAPYSLFPTYNQIPQHINTTAHIV